MDTEQVIEYQAIQPFRKDSLLGFNSDNRDSSRRIDWNSTTTWNVIEIKQS